MKEDIVTEIRGWSEYLKEDREAEELADVVINLIKEGTSRNDAMAAVYRVYDITSGMFGA